MTTNTKQTPTVAKPLLLILLPILFFPLVANAQFFYKAQYKRYQHYMELGLMIGATNYSGDVAERDIELKQTDLGFGAFFRYHISQKIHVKAQYYSGSISGDDVNSPTLNGRKFRFYTRIHEVAVVGEWIPLALEHVTLTGIHNFYVSPYFFIGIGAAHSKPEPEYYGLASDRAKYLRTSLPENNIVNRYFISMPIGMGIRFDYSERLTFGIEGGWRPVFNDNLDGISINGNPKKGDLYYFMGITASYFINEPWRPL